MGCGLRGAVTDPGLKRLDYWWTVLFTDPLAVPLTRFLATRRLLSPNGVSLVAFLLGVAVGPFFALGTRAGFIAGGILFYLAFLFDCMDGKLARALNVTSRQGHTWDRLADAGRRAGGALGLLIGTLRWQGEVNADVMVTVVFVVAYYFYVELAGADEGASPSPAPSSGIRGMLARRRLLSHPGTPDLEAVVYVLGPISGFTTLGASIGLVMAALASIRALALFFRSQSAR